jgi:competence protein ComEC
LGGSIGDHLGLAAATAVFVALRPESLLEAGLQMSFAATGRLVALFEARRAQALRLPIPGPLLAILQATMASLGAVLLTSLVAGLATDPLVAFHFQRFTVYGLAANLTAEPIVAFVIAPAATVAALAAPFGLSEVPLTVMRWGLRLVLAIGEAFADRPEAILPLPCAPSVALACVTLGMVWMMIWCGPVRWSGACGLAAALALMMAALRLVVLAWADLRTVLVWIGGDADWRMIARERGGDYTRRRLMELAGPNPQAPAPAVPMACQFGKGCRRRTLTDVVMEHQPRGWSRHDPEAP